MTYKNFAILIVIMAVFFGCASQGQNKVRQFGVEMAQKGLWKEASFRWRTVLEKDGPSAAILNNLAIACEAEGDGAGAESYYQQALKLAPDHPAILENQRQFQKLKKGEEPEPGQPSDPKKGKEPQGEQK